MQKALCIGINKYPDPSSWLNGCVNDAKDWGKFLAKRGFKVQTPLLDKSATKAAILNGMRSVITSLLPGETGIVTYSGHGTWLPDLNSDEPDKRDEALCPYDMDDTHCVIDDEISALTKLVPKGARFVLVTDSCHSATVFRVVGRPGLKLKARYLPPEAFVKGKQLRAKIKELQGRKEGKAPSKPIHPTNEPLPGMIHFGGCNDDSYSYDANFNGRGNGAFTYWALHYLGRYSTMPSYEAFFDDLKKQLPSSDYPQTPHFNATADAKKLEAFSARVG